ncbi:hypothetical protein J3R30DRAFT_3662295 [Lentinula aciculospora]|uniref:Uncharacterized protein n=1 Tax=Lentinula aciculospora TaxID=153920 RepID=A0A9W8ZV77_9AGAR|nr:hypothetical protein J3R30DRAFT_3662295 [Lentinula aciculospora]
MGNDSSSKLRQIYDSLPPEAKTALVDTHLSQLLKLLPKEKARNVISAATRLQKRYSRIPNIDLKGKKKEIRSLLIDLRRDSKRAVLIEYSNRVEIFSEIIESLTTWIADIWRVVYEHKVCFYQAHLALLYVWEVILELGDSSGYGGCNCAVHSVPVNFSIKTTSGKLIKRFSHPNIQHIDRILLWVWRELFVSMLTVGGSHARQKIPEMLVDIEESLGWKSLPNILYGGNKADDDDCSWGSMDLDDESEEDGFDDEDDEDRRSCELHARHWPTKINDQRIHIRDLIVQRLCKLFELEPSPALYLAAIDISSQPGKTNAELKKILSLIATISSSTFAAALAIYAIESETEKISKLLHTHCHLLRPQDATHYQAALLVLGQEPGYRSRTIKIIEKQLQQIVHSLRLLVESCFRGLNTESHKVELRRILKLQMASQSRIDRVNNWVDAVITPSTAPIHPMAFAAAMVMGIPPGLGDGGDSDIIGFLDMDPDDPDLEDLREEFRPQLRDRFDGWVNITLGISGGQTLLSKLYIKMTEEMTFLSAADVSEEMINRLSERSTKEHVLEALEGLVDFAKSQRKRKAVRQNRKRDGMAAASKGAFNLNPFASQLSSTSGSGSGSNLSFPFSVGELPSFPPGSYSGLDDVD